MSTEAVSNSRLVDLGPPVPNRAELVNLGNGRTALLGDVLDASNPKCKYCTLGLQTYREGARRKYRLCGCGVEGVKKRWLRAAVATKPPEVAK